MFSPPGALLDPAKQTGRSRENVKGICPSSREGVVSPVPRPRPLFTAATHLCYTSTTTGCMDDAATPRTSQPERERPFHGRHPSPYFFCGPGATSATFLGVGMRQTGIKGSGRTKEPYRNWSGARGDRRATVAFPTVRLDGCFQVQWMRGRGGVLSKFQGRLSGVVGKSDHLPRPRRPAVRFGRCMPFRGERSGCLSGPMFQLDGPC